MLSEPDSPPESSSFPAEVAPIGIGVGLRVSAADEIEATATPTKPAVPRFVARLVERDEDTDDAKAVGEALEVALSSVLILKEMVHVYPVSRWRRRAGVTTTVKSLMVLTLTPAVDAIVVLRLVSSEGDTLDSAELKATSTFKVSASAGVGVRVGALVGRTVGSRVGRLVGAGIGGRGVGNDVGFKHMEFTAATEKCA